MRPAEEGHRRAGRTHIVGKVEVVRIRHVLVDALLDEPEAQHANVEVDVLLDVAGDARDVVDTGNARGHASPPVPAGRTSRFMLVLSGKYLTKQLVALL